MTRLFAIAILALATFAGGCSVSPVWETTAGDHTPVPGNSNLDEYWKFRGNSFGDSVTHAGHTLKYLFLNTNSDLPPYDTFGEQLQRDKTTIHKTFDTFLFGADWDDPYAY
jgi:hypothetical protein